MVEFIDDTSDIKDTDIVFDCTHCGKSLAIDYRGAGLTIPCTDCGSTVEVPIPDGMELNDLDSSAEEQEMRILNLRRSVSDSETKVRELETALAELRAENEVLRKGGGDQGERLAAISDLFGRVQQEHMSVAASLAKIADLLYHSDSD